MFAFLLAAAAAPAAVAVAAAGEAPGAPAIGALAPLSERCSPGSSSEVVVCGGKGADERYRLRPIERGAYRDEPVRAEMNLGGGKLSLHNEDKDLGSGQHSKRAMITFTLPF